MRKVTNITYNEAVRPKAGFIPLLSVILVVLIVLLILDVFLGSVSISPSETFRILTGSVHNDYSTIIMKFRIPKALTALCVGVALSVSGLQMQTVFRNPLAGPDVLGISAGASFGVAFVIMGFSANLTPESLSGFGNWLIVFAAWIGAGAIMLLVMVVSAKVRDVLTILILGIMLSGGLSAIVTILQYFSNETMLKAYVIWTMGSLGNLTNPQLKVLYISLISGLLLSIISIKPLNVFQLGENYAASLGVNIRFSRVLIFLGTSILTGSITAFCGPIGFIGIAVPHIARFIFRTADHKILIPATILTGGALMLFSDIVSQLPGSGTVLPVNAVTSLIGIPVVIWVIVSGRSNYSSF